MTKFNKGDRFRCDSIEKDAIFTIIAVNFVKRKSRSPPSPQGEPHLDNHVSYNYHAVIFDDKGKVVKERIFVRFQEAIMIPV